MLSPDTASGLHAGATSRAREGTSGATPAESAVSDPTAKAPWWVYLIMAILDVEANFLVVSAYQYTSITSVMLLDCLSIPASMVLLRFCLGTRFACRHIVAAVVCLGGLAVLVISDTLSYPSTSDAGVGDDYPMRWAGDLLCVASALLYALSNVGQEFLVRRFGSVDYLGTMGGFGVLVSLLQLAIFQRQETAFWATWEWQTASLVAGFAVSLFLMYILTARFLQGSDAALFNLSLLTSDIWAILAAALLFQQTVPLLYFVSLGIVAAGLFLYHLGAQPEEVEGAGWFSGLWFLRSGDATPAGEGADHVRRARLRHASSPLSDMGLDDPLEAVTHSAAIGSLEDDYDDDDVLVTVVSSEDSHAGDATGAAT